MRRQFNWTAKQTAKLNKVKEILEELKDYLPLTLRQIYYQLVAKGFIENKVSEYTMLSNLLKWGRIDNYISWDNIEDRTRAYHNLTGWEDKDEFTGQELKYFLTRYRRDLLQTQKKYIEVWIEKDALSSIFRKGCNPYTVSVVVCRGFSSVSFLNDFRERLKNYPDKEAVMLYFGDFDPSGMEMLTAMRTTLGEEMKVYRTEFKRIALLKEDISKYNLPHSPDALKKTDTRARKHVETYGELAVELDALRPDVLQDKIKTAIESELDVKAFNAQIKIERKEIDMLNKLKINIENIIEKLP